MNELVKDYNGHAADAADEAWTPIAPALMGVLFTMISVYDGHPIQAQQQYIGQIKTRGFATMSTFIRENKTIYADAPEYGVPVVLERVPKGTYMDVRNELEALATEVSGLLP